MDPPSYDEVVLQHPAPGVAAANGVPPPTYDASVVEASMPPPTYGEAVNLPPDPYPMLNPPSMQTTRHTHLHPPTQIGIPLSPQTVVDVQPQSPALGDVPAMTRCSYCHQVVTTEVKYLPGKAAWCMCIIFTLSGLICGCCLIPFCVSDMQDAHHSCPQCHNHLHIHTR